VTIRRCIQP